MTLKLIIAPTAEPVSVAEAKLHLRVEHATDDVLIAALISAARQQAEHALGRALITQTWERVLDAFPCAAIKLGMPPVQSIVSVRYLDPLGGDVLLPTPGYSLDADSPPGWVLPAINTSWPATLDTANAVRVRFVCGYGAASSSVPELIRQWMLLWIGSGYCNREAFINGPISQSLAGQYFDSMLDPFRTWL